jgi:hypothetical protein
VPVAPDRLKALESFTLRGRKTGNESRALTPIVDEMRCKPDRKASSKTDEKTCPEHARIMVQCGGDIAAHWGDLQLRAEPLCAGPPSVRVATIYPFN